MIHIFRKEMKQWTSMLWVFILSIPLGYLSYWIFRKPLPSELKVASVNGSPIYLNQYQHEEIKIQTRIEMLKEYARAQGLSADLFLALEGLNNPRELAMQELINQTLVDQITYDLGLELDPAYFAQQLGKSVPQVIIDKSGRVNQRYYRDYLRQMHLSIPEYEELKEREFKREAISDLVISTLYIPNFVTREIFEKNNSKKSFSFVKVTFDYFLDKLKQTTPNNDLLLEYYNSHKEAYRIPESRKAEYYIITKNDYMGSIEVDEDTIAAFYDKNKNSLFRVSPQVKVKKISISGDKTNPNLKKKADEILNKTKQTNADLATISKEYINDRNNNITYNVVDFFSRGSYNPEFENAAFRLKDINEVSNLIEDNNGYSIIQLVERKAASTKPLEVVQDEIIKTIKTRRAQNKIKSDLELLMHKLRTNPDAFADFVEENKLKPNISDWLSTDLARGYTQQAMLAEKLFSKNKADTNKGYFVNNDNFILYKETARREAYIPPFEGIKTKVMDDYYKFNAQTEIKLFVNKSKKDLLSKTIKLDSVASELKTIVSNSGFIKKSDKFENIPDSVALSQRAFDLNDKSEVLKFKSNKDYFLVQLDKEEDYDHIAYEEQKNQIISDEIEVRKNLYLSAFIASLVRNAKIDHYNMSESANQPMQYADIE